MKERQTTLGTYMYIPKALMQAVHRSHLSVHVPYPPSVLNTSSQPFKASVYPKSVIWPFLSG